MAEENKTVLSSAQVDEALETLEGWSRSGAVLARLAYALERLSRATVGAMRPREVIQQRVEFIWPKPLHRFPLRPNFEDGDGPIT